MTVAIREYVGALWEFAQIILILTVFGFMITIPALIVGGVVYGALMILGVMS